MKNELFFSYCRKDNLSNRVTEHKDKIEAEYLKYENKELILNSTF